LSANAGRICLLIQYGVEYIDISCVGNYTLSFKGSTEVNLLPTSPHSGKYAFWSNDGDESDMTLTHDFDFTNVAAPIQMSYWTWYELEKGYDYAYLEASTDGQHWDVIHTPSCFDKIPRVTPMDALYRQERRRGRGSMVE